ncbi:MULTISPECIES: flagellar basal body-associated FliL family protein [unclassified Undibacterium]|uniref:flagellar basal body-associated FliL family protein n=1 Tax=unclassified Undibacterium TaxID=2630295 RepID=UPI002AC9A66A|nr:MULTISPECIES: flagellar basal body-associated FliL family protein [unclassified Undibacterium]MEB0140614.1 flagellar basal body-associated FliL family protein [Undibacterium sp. CCC2.1]MEB0173480.1 flagellar basal body-associated FliL family protein [Undibacterium sp. CCC1.1]MEB0177618.1 flagellar basal body-associated FliL family protein [Undibacterium sp. CCC3.4]MEB0216792.1 flagellar basal body-associated FliL family protein [Undibacterium sp. 5I2]WPX44658.1 flagellar basal body-associat
MANTSFLKIFLAGLLLCCAAGSASANSGAKEGGGGSPVAALEPFTVNLSSFDRYLQISITLQLGNPELGEKIKGKMPMVRHAMIMLLSSKESTDIQNADGKRELIEEIKTAINKILEVKEHDGVTDVYLVNFVIQ